MTTTQRCTTLKNEVRNYDTDSFAGFFAYFIRQGLFGLENTMIADFKSRQKDLLYLIALNAFPKNHGSERFVLDENSLKRFADTVTKIKDSYHPLNISEYSLDYVLHEMSFQNYFHNGTLSYVEQDLEKIRKVFSRFNDVIKSHFGFDVDAAIELYKYMELNFRIRFTHVMAYANTKEFQELRVKINQGNHSFEEEFNKLPEEIQDGFLKFHNNTYSSFLFTRNDFPHFNKDKVERFLSFFCCEPNNIQHVLYYTDTNPLENAPILKLGEDRYLHVCQKLIPIAIYNQFYQYLLKHTKYFDKIRKHREAELEKKVLEIFEDFFKGEAFFYINYYAIKNFEQDILILWKSFAFIIEIKATKMREPLRDMEKAMKAIKRDFKENIQYGYDQCKRVEDLFKGNASFNITNSTEKILHTIKPQKFNNVFSIVVTLERWGALQSDLSHLLDKQKRDNYPWSVYIDDLETFLLGLKKSRKNNIGNFVTFLKERQKLHGRSYAIDELDICAEYLMDTPEFINKVNYKEGFIVYSPKNQNFFDELYFAKLLKFKEKAILDPKRYFKIVPEDWNDLFQ